MRTALLFLPMVQEEIDRSLLRGGITDPADVRLRLEDSQLPNEVDVLLDMEYETLVLPADEEYLDAVKDYLDIDVFADAMLCDIRFKVPYIGELIRDTDCPAVEDYNDFAEALEDIWQKDGMLLTYAAVLEAENPETLHRACELLQDLDNYQRITEVVHCRDGFHSIPAMDDVLTMLMIEMYFILPDAEI